MKIKRNGTWAAQDIIALRKTLNICQSEFGRRLGGFSQITISRWESGRAKPSRMAEEKLANLEIDEPISIAEPIIESGIPIPTQGTWIVVARKMQNGDSVLLPFKEGRILMNCIRRSGGHSVQRKYGNDLRVWKVEKPIVHRMISQVMSELGSRKKTMTPAALEARKNAARKSADARREGRQ